MQINDPRNLPFRLRTLGAHRHAEVTLEVTDLKQGLVTQRSALDALEARYPCCAVLSRTISDHGRAKRLHSSDRKFMRSDQNSHRIVVRNKPEFLRRLMLELAGSSHMSLEGDLSQCRFTDDVLLTRDETAILKRNTIAPKQDFVVLRLAAETVDRIFKEVMAVGLKRAIIHVQIEQNGSLELGAYDHFDPECVVTGPGVSSALLDELKNTNVLRDFRVLNREAEFS